MLSIFRSKKQKEIEAQESLEKLVLELIKNPEYPEHDILIQITKFVKNGANLMKKIAVEVEATPPSDSDRELKSIFLPPTELEVEQIKSAKKYTVIINKPIAHFLLENKRTDTIAFATRIFELGGAVNSEIVQDINRLGVYIAFDEYKGPK